MVKATLESQPRRSRDQMPSTGTEVGSVGRQVVDSQPILGFLANSRIPAVLWTLRMSPDEDDRPAELLVRGDQQIPVIALKPPACGVRTHRVNRRPPWSV